MFIDIFRYQKSLFIPALKKTFAYKNHILYLFLDVISLQNCNFIFKSKRSDLFRTHFFPYEN